MMGNELGVTRVHSQGFWPNRDVERITNGLIERQLQKGFDHILNLFIRYRLNCFQALLVILIT